MEEERRWSEEWVKWQVMVAVEELKGAVKKVWLMAMVMIDIAQMAVEGV